MKNQAEHDFDGERERTPRQNRALHLYFEKVADTLNDAGLDMRAVLKPEVEIPWTKSSVKEFMWKPIQKLQVDKEHTADLTTKELDVIFNTMNRHLAKHGVHQPFPSIEAIMMELRARDAERLARRKK